MPTYTVYYCEIKPVAIPEASGSSGSAARVDGEATSVQQHRTELFQQFERILTELFQNCVSHIPNNSQTWTVRVRRIPTNAQRQPNYTGLTINMREPIVYLVSSNTSNSSSTAAADRRPSLVMIDALGDYRHAFSYEIRQQMRNFITGSSGDQGGRALSVSTYSPAVAEVFSHVAHGGATNWKAIMANQLANLAFHEIAHIKAECSNRATGGSRPWQSAISGTIHNVSGVGICGGSVAFSTDQTTADQQLMGRHMLCPVNFFRYGQAISGQFFTNGSAATLQTDAERRAAESSSDSSDRPEVSTDPLDLFSGDI